MRVDDEVVRDAGSEIPVALGGLVERDDFDVGDFGDRQSVPQDRQLGVLQRACSVSARHRSQRQKLEACLYLEDLPIAVADNDSSRGGMIAVCFLFRIVYRLP